MGHKSKANHATTIEVIVKLLEFIEQDALAAETEEEANELWKVGAYICTCTAGSLRGYEGFYADLAGLRKHINVGAGGAIPKRRINVNTVFTDEECRQLPHVVIPLLGKFKGENLVDHHLINVASTTMSGLKPRWWLEKLVSVCESEGRVSGPAFASPDGVLAISTEYDAVFRKYLKRIQTDTDLMDKTEDVDSIYGISRTPRRSFVSRAKRAGYKQHVDEVNRWRTRENAKGRKTRTSMQMLYAEAVLMMPTTWRVSYAL